MWPDSHGLENSSRADQVPKSPHRCGSVGARPGTLRKSTKQIVTAEKGHGQSQRLARSLTVRNAWLVSAGRDTETCEGHFHLLLAQLLPRLLQASRRFVTCSKSRHWPTTGASPNPKLSKSITPSLQGSLLPTIPTNVPRKCLDIPGSSLLQFSIQHDDSLLQD